MWFFSNILWSASQAKPTTSGLASIPLITWLMQSVTWAMLRTQICNWRIFLQSIIPTHSSRFNTLLLPYFYVDLSNNPSLSNKLLPPIRNLRIFYNRAKFFICMNFAKNIPSKLNSIHTVIELLYWRLPNPVSATCHPPRIHVNYLVRFFCT